MFSKKICHVRNLAIGGGNPVRVQTMYDSSIVDADIDSLVSRIGKLSAMGCDLIRFSYSSEDDALPFSMIAKRSVMPVVADIHFDYKLALSALEHGADKIRINPGNIGARWKTKEVVLAAKDKGRAIRIGLNSGSLPKNEKGLDKAHLMVETALEYINDFESWGFENTVVSLKASDIDVTMDAARKFASISDYPIHLGVTEAGSAIVSSVRSSWALGCLLSEHIGDTVRVSITGEIEDEVVAANEILRTQGLKKGGVRLVSCPRCGRHTFDSRKMVELLQPRLMALDDDITVAVMGCQVNGPGEAKDADYALTGIGRKAFLYAKGVLVKEVTIENAEDALFEAIENGRK